MFTEGGFRLLQQWRYLIRSCVISGFHRGDETRVLLTYYAACCGNSLRTFQDNLSFPTSWIWPLKMGPICSFGTSVRNYHTMRNSSEQRSSLLRWRKCAELVGILLPIFREKWSIPFCGVKKYNLFFDILTLEDGTKTSVNKYPEYKSNIPEDLCIHCSIN